MPKHDRDRGDAENSFDELKNQWGWGGYTSRSPAPSHLTANLVARIVTQISKELHQIRAITERWSVDQRWTLLLTRLLRRWLGGKWLLGLPAGAELLLSG
jgi:hypothetical protein